MPVAITVPAGILALPDVAPWPRTRWRGPFGAEPREDALNPLGLADLRALAASILLYYGTGLPLARCFARRVGGPILAWAMPCSLAVLLGGLFVARLIGLDLSGATGLIALAVLAAVSGPMMFEWKVRRRPRRDVSAGGADRRTDASRGGGAGRGEAAGARDVVRPFEWGLVGAMVLILLAAGGPLGISSDTFSHLAAIRRSLLGNAILPTDIFYRGGDGIGWDPRNGFLHPLHAFVCRLAGVDPLNLWRVLPAVFAPGLLLAVSRFLRAWTGPGRRGDLALLVWVLVGSGSGFLWLLRAGYPNHVAYPLSFLALAVAIDYLLPRDPDSGPLPEPSVATRPGRDRRAQLAAIGMLAFAGALIHLVASLLLLVGLGFLGASVFLDRSNLSGGRREMGNRVALLRRVGAVAVAAVIGMAIPLVFRLFTQGRVDSTLHTHPQGLFFLGGGWLLASPLAVLQQVGFAGLLSLLVLPLAAQAVPRGRRLALVFFTVGPWICVWTPLFTPLHGVLGYLVTRLLDLAPVGAVLVLALEEAARRWSGYYPLASRVYAATASKSRRGKPLRLALAGVAGGLVLFTAGRAVVLQPRQFRQIVLNAREEAASQASSGAFAFIRGMVEASPSHPPVVLADPFTSYALGGFTGAQFVATLNQHGPPIDRRWRDRLDDQREMLLGTVDAGRIDSLLAAYDVDLVFVNSGLSMPVADFGARIESTSMERARRHIEGAPEIFPVFYRGPDGIVAGVRPRRGAGVALPSGGGEHTRSTRPERPAPAAMDGAAHTDSVDLAAPADSLDGAVVVSAGPFAFGAISAVNVALPARPLARGETIRISLAWVRTGVVATDLPLVAHVRASTAVPPRWFGHPAWSKPARLLAQRFDHRLYRFRVDRPPFDWERNPARLPLHEPVPDRFVIMVPPTAAPGAYEVTLSLLEETLAPNFSLRDLLRDDDRLDGPVVGRITVR